MGFYGYQWWVDAADWFAAHGWSGQWIYLLPDMSVMGEEVLAGFASTVELFTHDCGDSSPATIQER